MTLLFHSITLDLDLDLNGCYPSFIIGFICGIIFVTCVSSRSNLSIKMPSTPSQRRRDIMNRFGSTPSCDIHPTTDFRLVRFSLGLTNRHGIHQPQPQPLELCFHGDFNATPQRPLSLHFDQSNLRLHNEPPRLAAPPPPGVMIDLGRIDVVAHEDDLLLVEDQIHREYAEAYRHQTGAYNFLHQAFSRARSSHIGILLLISSFCFLAFVVLVSRSTPPPPSSPTVWVPLFPQMYDITAGIAFLPQMLFFNQFIHPTIDPPDFILGKKALLWKSYHVTADLLRNVSMRIWDEEFHPYLTREQEFAALEKWFQYSSEFAGVTLNHTYRIRRNMSDLVISAGNILTDLRYDAFEGWLWDMSLAIAQISGSISSASASDIKWTPQDDLFIGHTNTSAWIPKRSLPKTIPPGIRRVLDLYRMFISDEKYRLLFDGTCKLFLDCKSKTLESAPYQNVCFSHKTVQDLLEHLSIWAFLLPKVDIDTDTKDYTPLASYLKTLVQMRDVMEQAILVGEIMDRAETRVPRPSVTAQVKRWIGGLFGQQYTSRLLRAEQSYASQLREIILGPFWQQFHAMIQGMLHVSTNLCGKLEAFSDLVESLYSPSAWIADEDDDGYIQLWKLPNLQEQEAAMNLTLNTAFYTQKILAEYEAWWEEWEALEDGDEQKWMELWSRNTFNRTRR